MIYLRLPDVADRIGVSTKTIATYIKRGELKAADIGTGKRPVYRFLEEDVDEFMRSKCRRVA